MKTLQPPRSTGPIMEPLAVVLLCSWISLMVKKKKITVGVGVMEGRREKNPITTSTV